MCVCVLYIYSIFILCTMQVASMISILFYSLLTLWLSDVDLAFFTPWIWPVWSLSLNLCFTKPKDRETSRVWCACPHILFFFAPSLRQLFPSFSMTPSFPAFSATSFARAVHFWIHRQPLFTSDSLSVFLSVTFLHTTLNQVSRH